MTVRKYIPILAIAILLAVFFTACNSDRSIQSVDNEKITVYTSFYTLYDFASKIGGNKIEIINMVPSGMEPHDYEPSPRDITGLSNADVFIYNGAGMESWTEKVLETINHPKLIIIEASKGISLENAKHEDENHKTEENNENGDEHGDYDPHVWLNPMNAKRQMEAIKEGFIQADPKNQEAYENNFSRYAKALDDLNEAYLKAVESFTKKEIVVSHEAFGYLCAAYGLEQVAIEGISGESEPTPAKMAEIVDFVQQNNVRVIFFEELASPKVAEAIARETGTKTMMLNPLEGLTEENLKQGKDYFSIMRENLEALKEALQ